MQPKQTNLTNRYIAVGMAFLFGILCLLMLFQSKSSVFAASIKTTNSVEDLKTGKDMHYDYGFSWADADKDRITFQAIGNGGGGYEMTNATTEGVVDDGSTYRHSIVYDVPYNSTTPTIISDSNGLWHITIPNGAFSYLKNEPFDVHIIIKKVEIWNNTGAPVSVGIVHQRTSGVVGFYSFALANGNNRPPSSGFYHRRLGTKTTADIYLTQPGSTTKVSGLFMQGYSDLDARSIPDDGVSSPENSGKEWVEGIKFNNSSQVDTMAIVNQQAGGQVDYKDMRFFHAEWGQGNTSGQDTWYTGVAATTNAAGTSVTWSGTNCGTQLFGNLIKPTYGFVHVKKISAAPHLTDVPNKNFYSYAGAKYVVGFDETFADNAILYTLTTDENGNTESCELVNGTYYIKEIAPSPGFQLDTQVYRIVLSDTSDREVISKEPAAFDPTSIRIYKTRKDD